MARSRPLPSQTDRWSGKISLVTPGRNCYNEHEKASEGAAFEPIGTTPRGNGKPSMQRKSIVALFLGIVLPQASVGYSQQPMQPAAPRAADSTGIQGTGQQGPQLGTPLQPPSMAGLPNLHRVSESLYRSAQPTSEGMRSLRAMGIRTIVNLRSRHSDWYMLGQTNLAYEAIPMRAPRPEEADIVRFLRIVTDPNKTPVLVHCQHGADRAGLMCAVYRIAVQHWPREGAIQEMTQGGFGFQERRGSLVAYINSLDIPRIKAQAGLAN